ncbi:hypothetical protein [Pseudomonas tohonis]|uniref:hypothetical protein n=1 Tax=Pseudomonas tohonis TaxID=2725477 RepID=UPI001F1832D2|nr:hypothetical protein [Pseudomonas tohonis]
MATMNDPKAVAYMVLHRFGSRDTVQVGDVLRLGNFQGLVSAAVDGEDLRAGLEYCIEQGWLEAHTKESVELTEAGLAIIQS